MLFFGRDSRHHCFDHFQIETIILVEIKQVCKFGPLGELGNVLFQFCHLFLLILWQVLVLGVKFPFLKSSSTPNHSKYKLLNTSAWSCLSDWARGTWISRWASNSLIKSWHLSPKLIAKSFSCWFYRIWINHHCAWLNKSNSIKLPRGGRPKHASFWDC